MKRSYYFVFAFYLLAVSCGTEAETESGPFYNFVAEASPQQGGTIDPSFGQYSEGKSIQVTAIPTQGWEFVRWEGDLIQSENPTTIRINKEYNVVGVFQRKDYALKINVVGQGRVEERIVSRPKDIDYEFETVVELTAIPRMDDEIWEFSEWGGDTTSTENPIRIKITEEKNITVTFTQFDLKEGEVFNPITRRVWMDRNLGATRVATSPTDAQAYGDLYQWGRGTDGHEKRGSATTTILSNTDQPTHGSFIRSPNPPYDWRSPRNDNLWQGVNGVNNPCPNGYRIPTEEEWNAERLSWSSQNSAGAFASPLKLPLVGYRDRNASFNSVGLGSNYWSGTVSGSNARRLGFNPSVAGMYSDSRAAGSSIRCIKD